MRVWAGTMQGGVNNPGDYVSHLEIRWASIQALQPLRFFDGGIPGL